MSTVRAKSPHHHHQPQHQQPPQQQRQQHPHQQHQQPLHNFSLPTFLKWPSSNGSSRVRREPHPHRALSSPNRSNGVGPEEGDPNPKKEDLDGDGLVEGEDGRKPWNLRPRRGSTAATAAAVAAVGGRNGEHDGVTGNRSRRNGDGGEHKKEEKEEGKKKRRLWIALTKEEIEEDVFIMTGCRPSRRPKKRNKAEQKQLDVIIDPFNGALSSDFGMLLLRVNTC